ncbi:MAG TPA: YCF48-related protein [Gaiellaceae bacterium]|jgi:photosystem II stability/assembly factor-like uncharacterized protein
MVRAAVLALLALAPGMHVTGTVRGHTGAAAASRAPSAVAFFTPREGVLGFPDGLLLRTADGGRTWTHGRSTPFAAADVVVARRTAFAVHGRTLLRTTDAGRSWRRAATLPFPGRIDFADARHGWLDGRRGLRATSDGGRSWRSLRTPCGPYDSVHVALADGAIGFALCGGQPATIEQQKRLYATIDGGRTWRLRASARMPSAGHAAGLVFRDALHGAVIANRVGVYATVDGGLHWRTALFTDDGPFVAAVAWPSARTRYALLSDGELARQDGARGRWRLVYPHTLPQPNVFAFADDLRGVGAGRAGLVYDPGAVVATVDGGRTWRARGRIAGVDSVSQLIRVSRAGLYAVALAHRSSGELLYRSRDDGRSWVRVGTPAGARFFNVAFASPEHGVLGDDRRRLYATGDGGRSWRVVSRAIGQSVLAFGQPHVGYALFDQTLYRTRDGGAHWRVLATPLRPLSIETLGASHAWIVAAPPCSHPRPNCAGAIFRTRDGGRSWQRISLNMIPAASELDFVSARVGYAKDPWTGLYRTRDGGRTWRYVRPAAP